MDSENGPPRQARTTILPDRLSELEHLYHEAPVGLCLLDLELRYVRINEWLAALNGKSPAEHIGRSIHEVIPWIAQETERYCRRVIETGGPVLYVTHRGRLPDISGAPIKYILASYHPLRADAGDVMGVSIVAQDITSLKETERLLLHEKQFTDSVIESTPGLFLLVDQDGRIARANSASQAFWGLSAGELTGRNGRDLIDPGDRFRARDTIGRILHEGSGNMEVSLRRHDGRMVPYLGRGARVEIGGATYVCVLLFDIVERKQAEDALRDSERKYRVLLENLHAAVVVHGTDSSILFCNHKATELLGISYDNILGRLASDPAWRFHREDGSLLPLAEYPVNRVLATREPLRDMVGGIDRPDQRDRVWVLVNAFPEYSDSMEVEDVVVTFIDITERKQAEQALAERYRFEKLIADITAEFVQVDSGRLDQMIEHSLARIAEFLGLDRATVALFSADRQEAWPSHSYSAPGIPALAKNTNFMRQMPRCSARILKGETLCFSDLSDVPADLREEVQPLAQVGMKAILTVPLVAGREVMGAVGFSSFQVAQEWPEDTSLRIKLVGQILANVLARRQGEESLRQAFAEIQQLKNELEAQCFALSQEIKLEHNFGEIVGNSPAIRQLLAKVEQVAPTAATVLILGETGTGKELIARAIHGASTRSSRHLVKVDCTALPPNLIESELFGHERGAFTGAHARQVGRFEIANGSTIFLDEIGELPLGLQAKLLRALQDGEFERLGSSRTLKVDVRVIAATNRDLEVEVRARRFREDLWYRLNVFPIEVPPLRRRREDIPLLVQHFVDKFSKRLGKSIDTVPQTLLGVLQNHSWPGNVRELENVIERAVINSQGTQLQLAGLLDSHAEEASPGTRRRLEDIERDHIIRTLGETDWRIEGDGGAAAVLGLNPSTLRGRMRKLHIRRQ